MPSNKTKIKAKQKTKKERRKEGQRNKRIGEKEKLSFINAIVIPEGNY